MSTESDIESPSEAKRLSCPSYQAYRYKHAVAYIVSSNMSHPLNQKKDEDLNFFSPLRDHIHEVNCKIGIPFPMKLHFPVK